MTTIDAHMAKRGIQTWARRFFRNNGLTLALLAMFLTAWIGEAFAGFIEENAERRVRNEPPQTWGGYVASPEFWCATGENWESEFLQMFFFIWMTTFLFQKGSPESNDPDAKPGQDSTESRPQRRAPWPVLRGGWLLALYTHSLSLAFLILFAMSFVLHLLSSTAQFNKEHHRIGESAVSPLEYLLGPRMWFESLQNWQSEFLAVASMVFLAVYLRERGSPESKRVESSHDEHE